jgi:hypothetical protein
MLPILALMRLMTHINVGATLALLVWLAFATQSPPAAPHAVQQPSCAQVCAR